MRNESPNDRFQLHASQFALGLLPAVKELTRARIEQRGGNVAMLLRVGAITPIVDAELAIETKTEPESKLAAAGKGA